VLSEYAGGVALPKPLAAHGFYRLSTTMHLVAAVTEGANCVGCPSLFLHGGLLMDEL
jgi:acyl dehydratase